MAKELRTYAVAARREMAALASPARQEIVDVLTRMGKASAAEIAGALGRPADALYYHLRALQRTGLVRAAGSRRRAGRAEALFRAVAPQMALRYDPKKASNVRAVTAIADAMLRLGMRDFRRALSSGDIVVSGPRREIWALRTTGWLLPREVAAVSRRIRELTRVVSKPQGRGRLYAITIVLTPLGHRARKPRRAKGRGRKDGGSS